MREEYLRAIFWLIIIGSWVFGVAYGRWVGAGGEILRELSIPVRVPGPAELEAWWQPIAYFALTALASFVLAQLFFGVGAAVFIFARGVHDGALILELETIVRGISFPQILAGQIWAMLFSLLILTVNLPLCLLAAHLGMQRASYMWSRIRGKPVRAGSGFLPIQNLALILAASLVAGLIGSFLVPIT